jgi:hypothetical protein
MNVQLVCQWILIVLNLICVFGHMVIVVGSDEGSKRASSFSNIIGVLVGTAIVYGAGGFSLTIEQWLK